MTEHPVEGSEVEIKLDDPFAIGKRRYEAGEPLESCKSARERDGWYAAQSESAMLEGAALSRKNAGTPAWGLWA